MAKRHIMPLGFIDRITQDGATFTLTRPGNRDDVRLQTPVTVWRYSPEHLAIAKVRGQVTAIGYAAARFTISETQEDPRWPVKENPVRNKAPVYLALPGSFEPDPSRMLSQEEVDSLRRERTPGEE